MAAPGNGYIPPTKLCWCLTFLPLLCFLILLTTVSSFILPFCLKSFLLFPSHLLFKKAWVRFHYRGEAILSNKTPYLVPVKDWIDNRATINGVKICFSTRHSDEIIGKKKQLVETFPPSWEILSSLVFQKLKFCEQVYRINFCYRKITLADVLLPSKIRGVLTVS